MRRIPIAPDPKEGESLAGYMLRLSDRYGLAPGDISDAIGYHPKEKKIVARRSPYRLTEDQKSRIAQATGISPERLVEMTLEHFDGRLFKADLTKNIAKGVPWALGKRVSIWDTAYCPECLAEDRTFYLAWQSRWSLVCVKHKTALIEECPKCKKPPSTLKRKDWPKDARGELTDVTRCWWARNRKVCRRHLTNVVAEDVSGDPELIASQQTVYDIIGGKVQPTTAGQSVDGPAFFSDLSGLIYLVRLEEQITSGDFKRREGKAQASSGLMQQLWPRTVKQRHLAKAMQMSRIEDPEELAFRIRDIGDLAYQEGNVRLPQLRIFLGHSEVFSHAMSHARQITCYADQVEKAGMGRRFHRRPADLPAGMETRHVPQLFWDTEFDERLGRFFEELDFTRWRARRLCSILLARMLEPLSWEEAAIKLGFDPDSHKHKAIWVAFSDVIATGNAESLLDEIRSSVNRRVESDGLVDFRELQDHVSGWEGVDQATYKYLPSNYKPVRYHHDHPKKRGFLSAMFWSDIVQTDEILSPYWKSTWDRYDLTKFQQDFDGRFEPRFSMLRQIIKMNPASSINLHLGMLIGDLRETDEISPRFRRHVLDKELVDRTLTYVSAHTGIDIPSITKGHHTNNRPAAEIYARLLTSKLLYRLGGCFWEEVASVLETRKSNRLAVDHEQFSQNLTARKRLGSAYQELEMEVRNGLAELPTPAGPEPHSVRRIALARKIKAETFRLCAELGRDETETLLLSEGACLIHTDLAEGEVSELHGGDLSFRFVRWARGKVRPPEELSESRRLVMANAKKLRGEAGYGKAYLERGLTQSANARQSTRAA